MTRREAREQALFLVFERTFQTEPLPEMIELAKEARELDPDAFTEKLTAGVFEHIEEIDIRIEKYSIGWNKERISRVVLSILRLCIYEMSFEDNIPISVSINEAVELAKKYAGEGDAAFINGILGTIARNDFGEVIE
jgi:N utilization substance protein B